MVSLSVGPTGTRLDRLVVAVLGVSSVSHDELKKIWVVGSQLCKEWLETPNNSGKGLYICTATSLHGLVQRFDNTSPQL